MRFWYRLRRYFLTGLLVVVPAWGTFLILETLFTTLDNLLVHIFGPALKSDIPGLGIVALVCLILLAGMTATQFLGQRLLRKADDAVQRIPFVRSIYTTLKGMTDLFNFRSRFDQSTVVVFPFPRFPA